MITAAIAVAVAAASVAVLAYIATGAPAQHVPAAQQGAPAGAPAQHVPAAPRDIPANVIVASDIDSPEVPPQLASASNAFAFDFYKQVSSEDGNVFFSPISMYVAFSLLYEGARGGTAAQIQDVFSFDPGLSARHNATAHAMAALNADDPHATLEMGNALWLADWFGPHIEYLHIARETYLATAERVDFATEDEDGQKEGVERVNEWAEDATHGKITKVLGPGDVNELTAMVITNAVYFKGSWLTPFPEEDTRESTFHLSGTESTTADFMLIEKSFDYADVGGAQVLRLPYKGDRLSMLVILPDGRDGLPQLRESISSDLVGGWKQEMFPTKMLVMMPKFETKTTYQLKDHLIDMGMPDVFFPDSADLSGIAPVEPGRNLYVTKAIHDAYVKLDEWGTEAAAVTTIIGGSESAPQDFIVNHPFMFVIYDEHSGLILFLGSIADPTA